MTEDEAKHVAVKHLGDKSCLYPGTPFFRFDNPRNKLIEQCYWFRVEDPEEARIGASRYIGIFKTNGTIAFLGYDSSE